MKVIIIYFTEDKKNFQIIKPSVQKNYHSFEIINY